MTQPINPLPGDRSWRSTFITVALGTRSVIVPLVPGRSPLTRGGTAGSAIWLPTARMAKDPTTLVAVVDLSDAELDELVEDAILDAHGEDERWRVSTT